MTRPQSSRNLLLVLATAIGAVSPALAQRISLPDSPTIAEQYLFAAANHEREARGLPLLHRDPQLARAAAQHARVMAAHGSISHQFPGEPELTDRGASAGVPFSVIAENVAEAPSAVEIHDMWMHSEHHRDNLLDPSVDSIGVSVIARDGELYAVEDFVKTVRAVSFQDQELAIGSLVARSGKITLASDPGAISAARQTCAISSGYLGATKPWFVLRFTSDSLTALPEVLKSKMASGRYREAAVGACAGTEPGRFTAYSFAVLLYP
jgi:uncharacterized protein YkwD